MGRGDQLNQKDIHEENMGDTKEDGPLELDDTSNKQGKSSTHSK